jgi:hypothetical protein
MPATNEEFIKKAFEAGLTEDQVRSAVAERNTLKSALQKKESSNPILSGISRVLNLPSNIAGGIIEASRGVSTGEYQAPQTGIRLPATKAFPQGMDLGELVAPSIVGAARGAISGKPTVMEEAPKTLGIDPNSALGVGVGLAGEIATPDLFDIFAVAKTGSKGISKLTDLLPEEKKIAPFLSQTRGDVIQAAKQAGIDLPVSAQTKSNFIRNAEALAQNSIFGGKITQKIEKAFTDVADKYDNITQDFVRGFDLEKSGDLLKTKMDDFVETFMEKKADLYDAIPQDSIKSIQVVPNRTKQSLQEIINYKSKSLLPGSNLKMYEDLLNKIVSSDSVSISNFKQTIKELNKSAKFGSPAFADAAEIRRVAASMSEDIDDTLQAVDPALYETMKEADRFYSDGINLIKSNVGKQLLSKNPEQAFSFFSNPKNKSQLDNLKSIVGKESFNEFKGNVLSKVFKDSTKDGVLNYKKLNNNIEKLGGIKAMSQFLEKDQYARLSQALSQMELLQTVEKGLKEGVKPATGSRTAFLFGQGSIAGALALLNPTILIPYILGNYLPVKALTSEAGEKAILQGVNLPLRPAIEPAAGVFGRSIDVGAAFADEVRQLGSDRQVDQALSPTQPGQPGYDPRQSALKRALQLQRQEKITKTLK